MKILDLDKAFSENINSVKYTDSKKSWKVSDRITIDWKNVLPKPPENNSEETQKELDYLQSITKSLNTRDKNLIDLVDKEPLDLYGDVLKEYNLQMPKAAFDKVWNITRPIIMNLKHQYNRPRPEQIAERLGFKVNVVKTKTHHTPAYPSGHTAYAAVGAYLLADMYPALSSDFFRKIGETGLARCLQGVHYPSDNEAAMVISSAIWQDIRYKLFPDLEPYRKV
jgi:acid phosphatase (class A)